MIHLYLQRPIYWHLITCIVLCLSGCANQNAQKSAPIKGMNSLSAEQHTLYLQALTALDQQHPDQAEEKLTQLIKSKLNVHDIWLNLGLAQYQQKNWTDAQKSVDVILRQFPKNAKSLNLAGLVAVETGDFVQAKGYFTEAITLAPNYPQALYNMALLQDVYLQNISEAIGYYNRYLTLVNDDETTRSWVDQLTQMQAQ
jgi:tetratricopeptide (TPR) repeat protein